MRILSRTAPGQAELIPGKGEGGDWPGNTVPGHTKRIGTLYPIYAVLVVEKGVHRSGQTFCEARSGRETATQVKVLPDECRRQGALSNNSIVISRHVLLKMLSRKLWQLALSTVADVGPTYCVNLHVCVASTRGMILPGWEKLPFFLGGGGKWPVPRNCKRTLVLIFNPLLMALKCMLITKSPHRVLFFSCNVAAICRPPAHPLCSWCWCGSARQRFAHASSRSLGLVVHAAYEWSIELSKYLADCCCKCKLQCTHLHMMHFLLIAIPPQSDLTLPHLPSRRRRRWQEETVDDSPFSAMMKDELWSH